MSVAFQSWDGASGLTGGYKIGAQGNHCGVEGSNHRVHPQQNNIIRRLTALSLYAAQSETTPFAEECAGHFQPACPSEESASLVPASQLTSCSPMTDQVSAETEEHDACTLSNSARSAITSVVEASLNDNRRFGRSHGLPDSCWNSFQCHKLDVVCEDRPWDNRAMMEDVLEPDTAGGSFCSSGNVSQVEDEREAHSSFKGHLDCSRSLGASLPTRKGLSRFYSGKSQSFSCLADAISVTDLAKPENPYNRRRKNLPSSSCNLDRPQLHPLQNGAFGISKKSLHNSKYTLALAVAMSTKELLLDTWEQDFQASLGVSRSHSNAAPSRSYSLSDLQGAGNVFSSQ